MDARLKRIQEMIKAQELEAASDALKAFIQSEPDNAMAWYMLSFATEDPKSRLFAVQKAFQLDPDNPKIQQRLDFLRETLAEDKAKQRNDSLLAVVGGLLIVIVIVIAAIFILGGDDNGADITASSDDNGTQEDGGLDELAAKNSSQTLTAIAIQGRNEDGENGILARTVTETFKQNRETRIAMTNSLTPTETLMPVASATASPTGTARVVIQQPSKVPTETPTLTPSATVTTQATMQVTNVFITATPVSQMTGPPGVIEERTPGPELTLPTRDQPPVGSPEASATASQTATSTLIPTATIAPPFSITDAVPLGTRKNVETGRMVVLEVWRPGEEAIENLGGSVNPAPAGEAWVMIEVSIVCNPGVICEPDPDTDLQVAGSSDARYAVRSPNVLPVLGMNSYSNGQVFGYTGAVVPTSESGLWLLYTAPSGATYAFALQ